MRRFFAELNKQNFFEISDDDAYHLRTVMRAKCGEKVEVIDKHSNKRFNCSICEINEQRILANIEGELTPITTAPIHLLCANPKVKTADFIVEKAVELGVSSIHFFHGEHSQGNQNFEQRAARFEKIKESAIKQSGPHEVTISTNSDLKTLLERIHSKSKTANELRLCLSTKSSAEKIKNLLFSPELQGSTTTQDLNAASSQVQKTPISADSYLVIGPEGGLSEKEEELLKTHSYTTTSLGQKILRVETAVIAACAAITIARN